jgi:hypothetical protein
MLRTRVIRLTRVRSLPDSGARTLHFKADGQTRRQRYLFFAPDAVPEFDGEEAWFLAERRPGSGWRIVRRSNPDGTSYDGAPAGDA